MADPVLIPDPAWTPCIEHPGHENHCSSGWCGACWLCRERGITERMVQAYDAGFASAERRVRASLSTQTPSADRPGTEHREEAS